MLEDSTQMIEKNRTMKETPFLTDQDISNTEQDNNEEMEIYNPEKSIMKEDAEIIEESVLKTGKNIHANDPNQTYCLKLCAAIIAMVNSNATSIILKNG